MLVGQVKSFYLSCPENYFSLSLSRLACPCPKTLCQFSDTSSSGLAQAGAEAGVGELVMGSSTTALGKELDQPLPPSPHF